MRSDCSSAAAAICPFDRCQCCCGSDDIAELLCECHVERLARSPPLRIRATGWTTVQLQHGVVSNVGTDNQQGRAQQSMCEPAPSLPADGVARRRQGDWKVTSLSDSG